MINLVRRLFAFGRSRSRVIRLAGPGVFDFDIVGESHYQKTLGKLAGPKIAEGVSVEVECFLLPENKNKYDSNAVAVTIDGNVVGYLSREYAIEFRVALSKYIENNCQFVTYGLIMGGFIRHDGREGSFGVRLDLDWPPSPEDHTI